MSRHAIGGPRSVAGGAIMGEMADRETVRSAIARAARELRSSGRDAPWPSAERLLAKATGREQMELIAHPEAPIGPESVRRFHELVRRRSRGEPLAYILGHQEFFGLDFQVGPGVLIPRPETEFVVEWALEELVRRGTDEAPARILDLGCGSANILGAILNGHGAARGVGVDREAAALAWAARNLRQLGLSGRALLVRAAMDEALGDQGPGFDLIVSNPPYVRPAEVAALAVEIRDHEPASALRVPEGDPWRYVDDLGRAARRLLRPAGLMLVEVGAGQARETAARLTSGSPLAICGIRRDLAGIERVVGVRAAGADRDETYQGPA